MADSETRTYLVWNRDVVTTYLTSMVFNNDAGVDHHAAFPGTWDGPYASQTNFTADTTVISQAVTYVSNVGDVLSQYVSHTGTSLTVSSTASIQAGYTLSGNGYSSGQTVVGFGTSTIVITSAAPNGIPLVGENIEFSPPQYFLIVSNNSGVGANWVASGNGYNNRTAIGFSGTNHIIMSGPPSTTPTPGGTITFTSPQTLLTLPAGSSSTFTIKYSNNTAVLGTYPSTITIRATTSTSADIVKVVSNFVGINTAPVDPGIDYGGGGWTGDGFGGDSPGSPGDGPGPGPGTGPGNSAGDANAGDGGNGSSADGSGSDGASATA
jgi:hypothetical protein